MTEILFSIAITTLAAAGLGLGLLMGRGRPRTSCGAARNLPRHRCADCPLRRARDAGAAR